MIRLITTAGLSAGLVAVAQTNLLRFIEIRTVQPDLVLVLLVYVSYYHGSIVGESTGFMAGIVEDLLSLAPPGFHALIRTVLGFVAGLTHNQMLLDPIFVPILLMMGAGLLQLVLLTILSALFPLEGISGPLSVGSTAIELFYTAILAPVLFAVFRRIPWLRPPQRI